MSNTTFKTHLSTLYLLLTMIRYWGISMANVDNIQHADAVQDSTSARLGIDAEAIDAKSKGGLRESRPLRQCPNTAFSGIHKVTPYSGRVTLRRHDVRTATQWDVFPLPSSFFHS